MPADIAVWLYTRSLALYPRSLRSEFAEEMTLVFEEQLADVTSSFDVLKIWATVVTDIFRVALPARFTPIAVPALAWLAALVWFIGVIGLMPLARSR